MTIALPGDLEASPRAEVRSGSFPSLDDAMAEAVRLLVSREHPRPPTTAAGPAGEAPSPGWINALRDDADSVDHAMKAR